MVQSPFFAAHSIKCALIDESSNSFLVTLPELPYLLLKVPFELVASPITHFLPLLGGQKMDHWPKMYQLKFKTKCLRSEETIGVSPGPSPNGWEPAASVFKGRQKWISHFKKRATSPFLCPLIPLGLSMNRMIPNHIADDGSSIQVTKLNANIPWEHTLETHPEIICYQISGHPLAQPSWHMQSNTTKWMTLQGTWFFPYKRRNRKCHSLRQNEIISKHFLAQKDSGVKRPINWFLIQF